MHEYGTYDAKICQNRAVGSSGTGTTLTCTGTGHPLLVGTGTGLSGTGTDCPLHPGIGTTQPVPVLLTVFCPEKCGILHFLLIFHPPIFSNSSHIKNPPWNPLKTTPKSGLESMKTLFSQVRVFPQNPNKKE